MTEANEGIPETQKPTSKSWYKVEVSSSHVRTRRDFETHELFVFARDSIDALDRAQRMRGWKKRSGRYRLFPSIRELNPEEVNELEEKIKEADLKIELAKQFGFYGRREH